MAGLENTETRQRRLRGEGRRGAARAPARARGSRVMQRGAAAARSQATAAAPMLLPPLRRTCAHGSLPPRAPRQAARLLVLREGDDGERANDKLEDLDRGTRTGISNPRDVEMQMWWRGPMADPGRRPPRRLEERRLQRWAREPKGWAWRQPQPQFKSQRVAAIAIDERTGTAGGAARGGGRTRRRNAPSQGHS